MVAGEAMTVGTVVIMLLSGGMDSCVTATIAALGYDVAALHSNYGQRTADRELQAFHEISDRTELVSRLHFDPRERDRRIRSAIEEYLAIPILEVTPPQWASEPTAYTSRSVLDNDSDHLRQLGAAVFG